MDEWNQSTFEALKCLVYEQRFDLGVNPFRANTPGAVGYRGYENNLAMWGTIAAVVFVFVGYGWLIGLLSVPIGIVAFLIAGRIIHKRAASRTRRWALSSASRFLTMWEWGVISVMDTKSGQTLTPVVGNDLGEFVRTAVHEILTAEGDPLTKKLSDIMAAAPESRGAVDGTAGEDRRGGPPGRIS